MGRISNSWKKVDFWENFFLSPNSSHILSGILWQCDWSSIDNAYITLWSLPEEHSACPSENICYSQWVIPRENGRGSDRGGGWEWESYLSTGWTRWAVGKSFSTTSAERHRVVPLKWFKRKRKKWNPCSSVWCRKTEIMNGKGVCKIMWNFGGPMCISAESLVFTAFAALAGTETWSVGASVSGTWRQ